MLFFPPGASLVSILCNNNGFIDSLKSLMPRHIVRANFIVVFPNFAATFNDLKIYIFWTVNGRLKGKTLWEKGIGFEHISDCQLSKWSLFDCTAVLPVVFFVIHVPLSFIDPFFAFDNESTSTREACNSSTISLRRDQIFQVSQRNIFLLKTKISNTKVKLSGACVYFKYFETMNFDNW